MAVPAAAREAPAANQQAAREAPAKAVLKVASPRKVNLPQKQPRLRKASHRRMQPRQASLKQLRLRKANHRKAKLPQLPRQILRKASHQRANPRKVSQQAVPDSRKKSLRSLSAM